MSRLLGLIHHEFKMSARRPSMWIAYFIIFLFFALGLNTTNGDGLTDLLVGLPIQKNLRNINETDIPALHIHNLPPRPALFTGRFLGFVCHHLPVSIATGSSF